MSKSETVTVTTNYWKVPSVEAAFSGWIENEPSPEERSAIIEQTLKERAAWQPNSEALALFEQLKGFIGARVRIEFWDAGMVWFENEAPFPVEADCIDLVLLEEDGFPQAYIQMINTSEVPTPDGFPSASFLKPSPDGKCLMAPLNGLYRIGSIITADDQNGSGREGR